MYDPPKHGIGAALSDRALVDIHECEGHRDALQCADEADACPDCRHRWSLHRLRGCIALPGRFGDDATAYHAHNAFSFCSCKSVREVAP